MVFTNQDLGAQFTHCYKAKKMHVYPDMSICLHIYTIHIPLYHIFENCGFTNVPIHEDSSQLAHFHVCKSLLRQWETWLPLFLMYLLICPINYILNVAKIPTTLPSPTSVTFEHIAPAASASHPLVTYSFLCNLHFQEGRRTGKERKGRWEWKWCSFSPSVFSHGRQLVDEW